MVHITCSIEPLSYSVLRYLVDSSMTMGCFVSICVKPNYPSVLHEISGPSPGLLGGCTILGLESGIVG